MNEHKPRGFAALSPEQRREIARKGGKRAHALGRAHRFDSEAASAAGKIPHQRGTAYRPKKKEEPPPSAEPAVPPLEVVPGETQEP
ncbi:MAG: KGG domain-containing protein [Polyangiales bacterium]